MPSRKRISVIWQHFSEVEENGKTFLQCKNCSKMYKLTDGSTTGAREHIKRAHPELSELLEMTEKKNVNVKRARLSVVIGGGQQSAKKIAGRKRKSTDKSLQKVIEIPNTTFQKVTDKIFSMIVRQSLSFSFVEQSGFKELMAEVAPQYIIPGKKTFSTTYLNAAMQQQVEKIRGRIQKSNSLGFAFTADIWKSYTGDRFIDIHVFYVDNEFRKIHCELLNVMELPETQSEDDVIQQWHQPLNIYGIESQNREMFITSNSGGNMTKTSENIHFSGITCIGHDLHLVIEKSMLGVPVVHQSFDRGSKIVAYINRSEVTKRQLQEKIEEIPQKQPLRLVQSSETRWNSCLRQEEGLQKVKTAVILMSLENEDMPTRTDEQWTITQQCVELMKPLEQLTKSMTGQSYPTLSTRVPTIEKTKLEIQRVVGNNHLLHEKSKEFGLQLIKNLVHFCLDKQNESTKNWSLAATAIDPRFKTILFEKAAIKEVRQTLFDLHKKIQECTQSDDKVEEAEVLQEKNTVEEEWSFLEQKKHGEARSVKTEVLDFDDELRVFWGDGWINAKECPLKWWRNNKTRFPSIAKLAQVLLAVPATSTSGEHMWSPSESIVVPQRESVDSSHFTNLLYVRAALFSTGIASSHQFFNFSENGNIGNE